MRECLKFKELMKVEIKIIVAFNYEKIVSFNFTFKDTKKKITNENIATSL